MHPKETKRSGGKLWHLEDTMPTKFKAQVIGEHLRRTEDKHARVVKAADGYQVWWSK